MPTLQEIQEYAQLSTRIYPRTDENSIPVPADWTELQRTGNASLSGFAAGGYQNFKYSDIGAMHYKSLPRVATAIEGLFGTTEKSFASRLTSQNAWHNQQGADADNFDCGTYFETANDDLWSVQA